MRATRDDLPILFGAEPATIRGTDWGSLRALLVSLPAGTDIGPLLKGLPNDLCNCPHWGFVIKGRIRISYPDRDEVVRAGDLFYWPPGHTPTSRRTSSSSSSAPRVSTTRSWTSSSETPRPPARRRSPTRYVEGSCWPASDMGEVIASLFSHAKGRLRKHPGDWLVSNERRHHRSRDVRPNVARPPAGTGRVRVMFLALLVVLFVPSRLIALTHGAGVARVLGVVAERSGITVRGNVVEFASSYSKNQYDASMRRLRQLENRVEMLEQAIGQSSRDDLAKLTQR